VHERDQVEGLSRIGFSPFLGIGRLWGKAPAVLQSTSPNDYVNFADFADFAGLPLVPLPVE
jgi:hypothetical protein